MKKRGQNQAIYKMSKALKHEKNFHRFGIVVTQCHVNCLYFGYLARTCTYIVHIHVHIHIPDSDGTCISTSESGPVLCDFQICIETFR